MLDAAGLVRYPSCLFYPTPRGTDLRGSCPGTLSNRDGVGQTTNSSPALLTLERRPQRCNRQEFVKRLLRFVNFGRPAICGEMTSEDLITPYEYELRFEPNSLYECPACHLFAARFRLYLAVWVIRQPERILQAHPYSATRHGPRPMC